MLVGGRWRIGGAGLVDAWAARKVGEMQAKKAFKDANAAYQQQDYKKAAELTRRHRRRPNPDS